MGGDDRARDRLVQLYLPLVETLANRYRVHGVERDDLVQVGSIGLLNAIERFDHKRGDEFAAFAVPTIVERSSGTCAIAPGPSGCRDGSRRPARASRRRGSS